MLIIWKFPKRIPAAHNDLAGHMRPAGRDPWYRAFLQYVFCGLQDRAVLTLVGCCQAHLYHVRLKATDSSTEPVQLYPSFSVVLISSWFGTQFVNVYFQGWGDQWQSNTMGGNCCTSSSILGSPKRLTKSAVKLHTYVVIRQNRLMESTISYAMAWLCIKWKT